MTRLLEIRGTVVIDHGPATHRGGGWWQTPHTGLVYLPPGPGPMAIRETAPRGAIPVQLCRDPWCDDPSPHEDHR